MSGMEVEHRLHEDLLWTPALGGAEITVSAEGGTITLHGTVPSFAARYLAEGIAGRSDGVETVVNELIVVLDPGSTRDDRDIRKLARRVLEGNAMVPDDRVEVSVEEGFVTLEGEVDWPFQKESAMAAIVPLIGVRGITNAIAVRDRAAVDQVVERIRQALHRTAEIEAERVRVTIEGGKVILRGMLRTSAEIQAVEGAAWAAPGVSEVESHLRSEEELASV